MARFCFVFVALALVRVESVGSQADKLEAIKAAQQRGSKGVPSLIKYLADREVDKEAIVALSEMGEDARQAIPSLMAILTKYIDTFDERAMLAYDALVKIGRPAVPALTQLVSDETCPITALEMLVKIGPGAQDAIPSLERLLKDDKCDAKSAFVVCYHRIDSNAHAALYFIAAGSFLCDKEAEDVGDQAPRHWQTELIKARISTLNTLKK